MSWFSKTPKSTGAAPAKSVAAPVKRPMIVIDRHEYMPSEFAIGSFRIQPYEGDLIARQQFDFKISFQLDGEIVEFGCRGVVVKLDEQAGFVARYTKPIQIHQNKLLAYLNGTQ